MTNNLVSVALPQDNAKVTFEETRLPTLIQGGISLRFFTDPVRVVGVLFLPAESQSKAMDVVSHFPFLHCG